MHLVVRVSTWASWLPRAVYERRLRKQPNRGMRSVIKRGALTIPARTELVACGIRTLLVGRLGTDLLDDSSRCQIVDVCLWRLWIIARCTNVINVEVCHIRQWSFNCVVADIVRVAAR
jgi:hypothetical protein